MARTLDEVAALMSMKADTIESFVEVADGTLVTTVGDGAQTLIKPDGKTEAVLPRRDVLNVSGRGSVERWEEERAAVPKPDLTPVVITLEKTDLTGTALEFTQSGVDFDAEDAPVADPEAVPDGSANDVLAWAGDDRDRLERALDAELKRESPRSTLVNKLSNALAKIGANG